MQSRGINARNALVLAAAGVIAIVMSGCASPAKPMGRYQRPAAAPESGVPDPSGGGRNVASISVATLPVADIKEHPAPLDGVFSVEFISSTIGPVGSTLTAQALRGGDNSGPGIFKANTRPGVAWDLIGGVAGAMGPLIAPYIFPQGMLIVWESTMPGPPADGVGPSTIGEGWMGISTVGPFRVRTKMKSAEGPIELIFKDGRTIALMTMKRIDNTRQESRGPTIDYVSITGAIDRTTRERLYDPAVTLTKDYLGFVDKLGSAAPGIRDDLEYFFSGALAWRAHDSLPLSLAYKPITPQSAALLAGSESFVRVQTLKWDKVTRIATIESLGFDNITELESVVERALAYDPRGVIIDLRSCPGFDASAFLVAAAVMPGQTPVGTFVAASRRGEFAAAGTSVDDVVTLRTASDVELFHTTLDEKRAASLMIEGRPGAFTGPVAILTFSRTRGTAEVLARTLQRRTLPTRTFGGPTASRPRLSLERPLEQGYVIRVPEFDWKGPEADARLGRCRVTPDQACSKDEAPAQAAEWIERVLNRSVPIAE